MNDKEWAEECDIKKFTNEELHIYIAGMQAALTELRAQIKKERKEYQRTLDEIISGKLRMP